MRVGEVFVELFLHACVCKRLLRCGEMRGRFGVSFSYDDGSTYVRFFSRLDGVQGAFVVSIAKASVGADFRLVGTRLPT